MRNLLIMMCVAVLISGCGEDEKSKPASATATTKSSPAESAAIPVGPAVSKKIDGIMIVDHARDEKEFELRRSISGVVSMINTNKEQGLDTAELEAQLTELQKQLKALISG